MQNTNRTKKLTLSKQTVRTLQDGELSRIAGAWASQYNPSACFCPIPKTLNTCIRIICEGE
jgi:hypothetical protein